MGDRKQDRRNERTMVNGWDRILESVRIHGMVPCTVLR